MDKEIFIKDFFYDLPQERIALFPLPERDQSKLLVYNSGSITHSHFNKITEFLPSKSTLFFNNTKVIPARIHFQKSTGAIIEIFLLHPVLPSPVVLKAMEAQRTCSWECTIGNLKRWNTETPLIKTIDNITFKAHLRDREKGIVEFSWTPEELSFAEVVLRAGITPLPPYLKREAEESDKERYQTVYSHFHGAVAAPTAGLHFTDRILDQLKAEKHKTEFLTLHVSAGTFQPVKVENATNHVMHGEQILISKQNIEAMLDADRIVAVGTTSMRTLESLYWYSTKLANDPQAEFTISQHDPYLSHPQLSKKEALTLVLNKMNATGQDILMGETSVYILPGYDFKMVDVLITNFHQPGSTLILLIAAFIGEDWRKVYQQALDNNYRFLSYGDSSLLSRQENTIG
jgi:S-adenosylmethionine:tRNA ribosyltransferase-isomerase